MALMAGAALSLFNLLMNVGKEQGAGAALLTHTGLRLLEGDALYRDMWYGGLPGAALCNALSAMIWQGRAGTLAMGLAFVVAGAGLVYGATKRGGGSREDSWLGAGLVVFSGLAAMAIGGDNSAYQWGLPAQAMFVYFAAGAATGEPGSRNMAIAAGLCGGAAALFFPRELALAFIGIWMFKGNRLFFASSFALPLLVFLWWLESAGAVGSFGSQTIDYYRALAGISGAAEGGGRIELIKAAGAMIPLAAGFVLPDRRQAADQSKKALRLIKMVGAWAAYEAMAIAALRNETATEFLAAAVPAAVYLCLRAKPSGMKVGDKRAIAMTTMTLVGFIAVALHASEITQAVPATPAYHEHAHDTKLAPELARTVLGEKGRALVWGKSSETYLEMGRGGGMKYSTITPLFTRGYGEKLIPEHMKDLRTHPPDLLILEMSLLPDGVEESIAGDRALWLGPAQKKLLALMKKMTRDEYKILAVNEGKVFCARKSAKKLKSGKANRG